VSRQAQAGRHTAKAAGRVGGGRKPEDDPEGRPEGRAEAKGASPERKSDLKGTGRTGSQEPVRNGRPGDLFQAQAGRQRKGTPRQGQRAGKEAGGASRTWKAKPEGGFKGASRRIESPGVQAGGSWPLQEAQAARQAQGVGEQTSGPMPRGWIEGASRRDDPKGWAGDERHGSQGSGQESRVPAGWHCQRDGSKPGARRKPNACARVGQRAGWKAAGDEGAGRKVRAGVERRPEGGRRVERRRRAQAWSGNSA